MNSPIWLDQASRAPNPAQTLPFHQTGYNSSYDPTEQWGHGPVPSSSSVDPQAFWDSNPQQTVFGASFAPAWLAAHQTPLLRPAQEPAPKATFVPYPQQSPVTGHRDAYAFALEASALSQYRFPCRPPLPSTDGPPAQAQVYQPSFFPHMPTPSRAPHYSDESTLRMPDMNSPTRSPNNSVWTPHRNPPSRPRSAPIAAPLLYNSPNAPPTSPQSRHKRVRRMTSSRDIKSGSLSPLGKKPAPPAFVNFTAADGKKLLTGVAPSGSSKRKQRETEAMSKDHEQRSKRRRATGEKPWS